MANISDAKFSALRTLLYTGSNTDMTLQWLQANGATSNAISDAWAEMLDAKLTAALLTPTGDRSTDWYTLLGQQGYTGALSDRELAFWVAGGTFV